MPKKLLKPRDPAFLHMVARKQGAQTKSAKAQRSRDKAKIKSGRSDCSFLLTVC